MRPRGGLKEHYDEALTKWIKKQQYSVYSYEGEQESRHLHGQVWYDEPKRKADIQKALTRIAERKDTQWDSASRKVLVGGVKIAYNNSFMDNYITKEKDHDYYNPPLRPDDYYPSEEEQAQVMKRANAKDHYFHKLSEMWGDKELQASTHIEAIEEIGLWYYQQMYQEKTIPVISDTRVFKQKINSLIHYLYPMKFDVENMILTKDQQEAKKNINDYLNIST